MWFNTLDMRRICECVTVNTSLIDQNERIYHFKWSPAQFFFMHFIHCLGKPPSSTCLSLFWWGEETRSTTLQEKNRDMERLPGWHSSKDSAYLARGMATIIEAHKWINSFCYLSKMQWNFTPSCLFSFQIISRSFRSMSCYSGAEESENQCVRSVCI